MALMYDMETVNRAMTEAAKLYDPKHKSAKRVKKVLDIFAGMKPVQTGHGRWLLDHKTQSGLVCWVCSCCKGTVATLSKKTVPVYTECPHCNAIMDGEVEP